MTITFTTPVRRPKAEGYNLSIDGVWWRTISNPKSQIQLGTRDSLAPRQDDRGSIYNNVLDIGYAWARTDLSGGEGLDWDPREIALEVNQIALDPIRYWDSVGIDVARPDVSGNRYALRLARDTQIWDEPVVDPKDLAVSDTFIYVADGAIVSWYAGWENTIPIGSDTLPADVIALAAAPNDTVVATCEDGNAYAMRQAAGEIVFTLAYGDSGATKLAAQGVWFVNGRFIMSTFDTVDVSELRSLDYAAAAWGSEVIDTANGEFWSTVESGPAIVSACSDGTVRTYTPTADDPELTLLPRARLTMPEGESPILLGSNAGILLIMTTADHIVEDREELRLYQAEVLDARFNFVVGQVQLKREWRASDHEGLVTRNMTNTRDEIFFFVKEENEQQQATDESLWRFDVVTAGLSRVSAVADVNLNGLVVFDQIVGGINFGTLAAPTPDIRISDPEFRVLAGAMIFPNITFGLNTDISWLATVVEVGDLTEGGALVELLYSTDPEAILDFDHPSWTIAQRLASQGASNIEKPLRGVKSRTLALQLRMFSNTTAAVTPQVTRISIRGIPAHRDFIMMVPINISDYVSVPGRKPTRVPNLGDTLHRQLLDRIGENVEVNMLDPSVEFRGVMNNVSEPIEYQASRGTVSRYCIVEFRGQRITSGVLGSGNAALGIGLMGVSLMGVEDNLETTV